MFTFNQPYNSTSFVGMANDKNCPLIHIVYFNVTQWHT
jgi:hypothetical protein